MNVRPEDLVELLDGIDPSKPHSRNALGQRQWIVRCRVPVVLDAEFGSRHEQRILKAAEGAPAQRAEGEGATNTDGKKEDVIIGPSSSTSQDWYGTRMTRECLEDMAAQFKAGVDYLPRHHSFWESVEWYEQIGATFDAELVRSTVKNPPEGESATEQWILLTHTKLWLSMEIAQRLVDRCIEGHPPGQSIGGWFREIQVTYDDDGYVVYPINVMRVELDHLAAVRSPANPDADKVWLALSTKLETASASLRSTDPAPGQTPTPNPSAAPPAGAGSFEARSAPVPGATDSSSVQQGETPAPEPVGTPTPQVQHSDAGAQPPSTASDPTGRAEVDMTPEQMAALAALIGEQMRAALAPVQEGLAQVRAAQSGGDPAPAREPELTPEQKLERAEQRAREADQARAAAEQRALAAEQLLNAGGSPRSGQRNTGGAPPSPGQGSGNGAIPELFRGPDGTTDMRTIAPNACRRIARSGGEEDLMPALVLHMDGTKALAQFAQVQGTSKRLAQLCLDTELLQEDRVFSRTGKLRCKAESELRELLSDIIYSGAQDGLIRSGSQYTSWAG